MPTTSIQHDVFHQGELAVQERAAAVAQGRNSGRLISDTIIPGAIKFVSKQPFVIVGSIDENRCIWASIVVGSSGFMVATPYTLDIDLSQALLMDSDPIWRNLASDPRIGILVIDLRSRARLRVNGSVASRAEQQLHIEVEQAYPNCPKYIQRRNYRPNTNESTQFQSISTSGASLSNEQHRWLTAADTLFVASEHPTGGVDASHRGGNPGFIQVLGPNRLRIPDYAGNGMFNTLGNFAANPRAGLVVPDFEKNRTLQLTGGAEILWDVADPENKTGGTCRYWDFEIARWVQTENSLPGAAEFLDYFPQNPRPRA